ncbi:MAG: acyl-ACP--UDP-N-acetylglucosamine O-acyltransferase [Pseudomonadota bacterium]
MIHPQAQVDPQAKLDEDVYVGPWTEIGPGVEIGAGSRIESHSIVRGNTYIGKNNHVFSFCTLGDAPQDKKYVDDGQSRLLIGDGNTIREYCSVNCGTQHGGGVTRIGDDNWIMAYCHIAHDCQVGNHTIFANNATLAGHVEIHDYVILGGFTGVHQFCRMGESSFSAISAIILKDVPPYFMVEGNSARPRSVNRVGLKRRGFSASAIADVKSAYKILYRQSRTLHNALDELEDRAKHSPEIERLVSFIKTSDRGIVREPSKTTDNGE